MITISNNPLNPLDSGVINTVAKSLWPTMLFVSVMSILVMWGLKNVWLPVLESQTTITISFFLWFSANLFILIVGVYLIILDARTYIRNVSLNKSA